MADNFLERHMRDYEEKKAKWEAKKKHLKPAKNARMPQKPTDEAL